MKKTKVLYKFLYFIYFIIFGVSTAMILYFAVGEKPKFMYKILASCDTKYTITGTYYLQRGDNTDKSVYIEIEVGGTTDGLQNGDWHDSDGLSGAYSYSSGSISFYDRNKTLLIASGTIEDGVMKLKFDNYSSTATTYVKK